MKIKTKNSVIYFVITLQNLIIFNQNLMDVLLFTPIVSIVKIKFVDRNNAVIFYKKNNNQQEINVNTK